MMAIFENNQIGNDIIRFYNIAHDGVDYCRWLSKGINPDTGADLEIPDGTDKTTYIQTLIRDYANAAKVNATVLKQYAVKVGSTVVEEALKVSYTDLINEIDAMILASQTMYDSVLSKTSETLDMSKDVTVSAIPQWKSIRRLPVL